MRKIGCEHCCVHTCAMFRSLRSGSEPEVKREEDGVQLELASLCHQLLERNIEEPDSSTIEVGLPGCYKEVFVKIGGITYVIYKFASLFYSF